ncbi:retrovirus-related pol polyprotein from transposon TNT 1-94 [Tanacetum coccineum]
MTSSEQSNDVSQTETEITSDSNIIPYSQYLSETQQATVQNSDSSAQQDEFILSVVEQLKTQVMTCTKINLENKSVNDTLTAELDRYKEKVKVLKEKQNVGINNQTNFSVSNEQNTEIERLKQILSEQMQEKESLMKTVSVLKTDFKKEENRNIDREIALEKKIKQLDNIIFKMGQSAQTVHMLTKSKICYDYSTKQAIGFEKPFYLKKARESEPKLYDGNVILNTDTIEIPNSEETLMLVEENKRFVRQSDLYAKQAYWRETSVLPSDLSPSSTTDKVEVVKERTTATAITEGTWGFEHIKACFRDEIIPFIKALKDIFNNFNQYLVDELAEVYTAFYHMEQAVEQHLDTQLNQEIFQQENSVSNQSGPSFNQLFELNELRAKLQEKDTVIMKLKEQIKSLKGNVDANNVKMDMDEIETLNIELEHRVSKLVAENEHLKQTYKQLYDSIKPARVQSKEQCDALIKQVNLKSVEISDLNAKLLEQVSKMDMEPITPKLLNKKTAHSTYIKHTQEEVLFLSDIVEHEKANYPQDPLLEYAFRYTKVIQELLSHIRVRLSTSASESQPSGNTRNDKIQRPPSSNLKNKHSKKNENSDFVCIKRDNCMSSDKLCVSKSMNDVKSCVKSKPVKKMSKRKVWKPTGKVFTKIGYIWRPTGRIFTLVGNVCPLTMITTTTEVPSRKLIVLETETPKPVVTLVYSRKPRKNKNTDSVSKPKVVQIVLWYLDSGVDLLTGSRGDNLYTLSLGDMMASSPICLLSKASKTKSWLWHRKSTKKPYKPKSEDTNQEKLYLLYMDLCGPMHVASVNGKKYILMIQVRLKETVRRIRTDNGTEFVNQTLREYYEKVGISHETSVARSPQQNDVAEAVATSCYTQNRSMIRRRHGKTPYELLHNKPPDLSYLHVFGALCYPTNDNENSGKLQSKVDIGPALHDMTPATISSGLVPNPHPSTPFVPPSRTD